MTEDTLTPYSQRQRLMGLVCALALKCGLRAGRYRDPEAADPRFAGVLHVDLPTGQLTIHTDEQDVEDFAWHALPLIERLLGDETHFRSVAERQRRELGARFTAVDGRLFDAR